MSGCPVIAIGWPAIIAAMVLSVLGIIRGQAKWVMVAAIAVVPLTVYLAGTPRFGWFALVFPLTLVGTGVAIKKRRVFLACLLLTCFVGISGWLAFLVVRQ